MEAGRQRPSPRISSWPTSRDGPYQAIRGGISLRNRFSDDRKTRSLDVIPFILDIQQCKSIKFATRRKAERRDPNTRFRSQPACARECAGPGLRNPLDIVAVHRSLSAVTSTPTCTMPVRTIRGDEEDFGNPHLAVRTLVPVERSLADSRRFSVVHHGRPQMLDHLLVSRSLLAWYRSVEIPQRGARRRAGDLARRPRRPGVLPRPGRRRVRRPRKGRRSNRWMSFLAAVRQERRLRVFESGRCWPRLTGGYRTS